MRVTLTRPGEPEGECRRVDIDKLNLEGTIEIGGETWKVSSASVRYYKDQVQDAEYADTPQED